MVGMNIQGMGHGGGVGGGGGRVGRSRTYRCPKDVRQAFGKLRDATGKKEANGTRGRHWELTTQ